MNRLDEIRANLDAGYYTTLDSLGAGAAHIRLLLAERDRLAAEVEAARAVADEMHVNRKKIGKKGEIERGILDVELVAP